MHKNHVTDQHVVAAAERGLPRPFDLDNYARYCTVMNDVLPTRRRFMIASRLAAGGAVTASLLAAEFDVSEAAIGRDLRALAADGICKRVYGGALPISPASSPINVRIGEQPEAKRALARMAVSLVQSGESLFLDNGSTNLALALALPNDRELTVVTNAIAIAAALVHRPGIELIMIGGEVNPAIGGCVDASAVLAAWATGLSPSRSARPGGGAALMPKTVPPAIASRIDDMKVTGLSPAAPGSSLRLGRLTGPPFAGARRRADSAAANWTASSRIGSAR